MGYTFHTVNSLTLAESNLLIRAFNEREEEKKRELKKNKK
jgi:hypothetical protein